VKLPGFRPGKAPKEMVERVIDQGLIESRAAQNLIADLYPKLVDEAKLSPVDYPKVEIVELQKDKPFVFKVKVDVYPEIKLGKYKGIKAEKKLAAVTEEEVLKVLGNLQERFTKAEADGKKETLPLDDEFAKKVSNFSTLAELKTEINSVMLKDRTAEAEAELKNKLIAAASNDAKLDIPPAMIEREIDVMLDELRSSLAQSNLTLDDYLKSIRKEEKQLREEFGKAAETRIRGKVILQEIAKEEKLLITEDDMDKELTHMASTSGQEAEEFKKRVDAGFRKYVEEYLLRQKALELILEKANVKEVTA
jgi:trigger factor